MIIYSKDRIGFVVVVVVIVVIFSLKVRVAMGLPHASLIWGSIVLVVVSLDWLYTADFGNFKQFFVYFSFVTMKGFRSMPCSNSPNQLVVYIFLTQSRHRCCSQRVISKISLNSSFSHHRFAHEIEFIMTQRDSRKSHILTFVFLQ